jgi:PqqD family protein of HPr-rel-A system
MSEPAGVRFHDTVRVRLGADRGFLFDQRSGRVYSLNATAAFVAARLRGAEALPAVAAAVAEAFDVDPVAARRDLAAFVADLAAEGLVATDG